MIKRTTVTRDDGAWQGHPDVAFFKGKFYVAFRQSEKHKSDSHTSIRIVKSEDGIGYSKPKTLLRSKDMRWNCPRLSVVDGRLFLVADLVDQGKIDFVLSENDPSLVNVYMISTADGKNWSDPVLTAINGIVPDRLLKAGDKYLLAAHIFEGKHLVQRIWSSTDLDRWKPDFTLRMEGLNLCEASLFPIKGDTRLGCLMRENSQKGLPAYYSMCGAGFDTEWWTQPEQTRLFGCHRPTAGMLRSNRWFVTYREQTMPFNQASWARNVFACLCEGGIGFERDAAILPLDHDASHKPDGGYTGWVQLEDESIYIVNYITDDAPKPYIVSYRIKESDIFKESPKTAPQELRLIAS